jgi:hypothetical protein
MNTYETPRAKCPKCIRFIGVKGGVFRDHGKAYGRRDYTNCPGTGMAAPFFAELTTTEADVLQSMILNAIYANHGGDAGMVAELVGMRKAVIREGCFHGKA